MFSDFKVELFFGNNKVTYKKLNQFSYPFSNINNIEALSNSIDSSHININLYYKSELDWEGIFFIKKIKNLLYIFSGGRFGFCGFFPILKKRPITDYLETLKIELSKKNIESYSLTATLFDKSINTLKANANWTLSKITYYVADVKHSVSKDGLRLESFKKNMRKNIKRNLRMAHSFSNYITITKDLNDIKAWYKFCHLKRIKELNGKSWDINLIFKLVKKGNAHLVMVKDSDKNAIGGCIMLISNKIIELFMMSTTKKYLSLGINYLLTEFIYNYAYSKNIDQINWQASNPQNGSGAKYKVKWNAFPTEFHIYSNNPGKQLTKDYLISNFNNCYLYPYEELKK